MVRGFAWLTGDEAPAVKGFDHLVNRWWGDPKETLHGGLGGWNAVDLRVIVNECEELTLLRGIVGSHWGGLVVGRKGLSLPGPLLPDSQGRDARVTRQTPRNPYSSH